MKRIVVFFAILSLAFPYCAGAETYAQCKKKKLEEIKKYEETTGLTVSDENKRLAVQAKCGKP